MMHKLVLSYILHHANRESKEGVFYAIKDKILSKYGKRIGYDIQHLPGKWCNACGGTGVHKKYSMYPPYKVYDYADCYHCMGGYYRYPQWICLARIKFDRFIFHKPLKREYAIENPWTENEMGWNVSDTPVIEGYVNHKHSKLGPYALLILYFLYNRQEFKGHAKHLYQCNRWRLIYKFRRLRDRLIIHKPQRFNFVYERDENDIQLPF